MADFNDRINDIYSLVSYVSVLLILCNDVEPVLSLFFATTHATLLVFLSCPFDPQRKSSPQALQLQSHIPVYYEACFTVQEINNSEKVKPY